METNIFRCSCGYGFCYLCGKEWVGLHGCPHYGQASFDDEGYNQDGYHRESSLNREGLTRRQEMARRRGEDPDEDEDETDPEVEDEEWEVMQHITPEQRMAVNILHGAAREDALDNLRIQLFEAQGITFGTDPGPMQVLTERQLDIVDAIMDAVHIAHDPLLTPLLNRLRNEATTMDEATVVATYRPIADLYITHMSAAHARSLISFLPSLNALQTTHLAQMLGLHLAPDAAQSFAEYLLEQLLATHAPPLTPDQQRVLDRVLHVLETADIPLLAPLRDRLATDTLDGPAATHLLSRIAQLNVQHLPIELAAQMAALLAALTPAQIGELGERIAPELGADRVAEYAALYMRWLGEVQGVGDEGALDAVDEAAATGGLFIDQLAPTPAPLVDEHAKDLTSAEAARVRHQQASVEDADAGETRAGEWDDDDL